MTISTYYESCDLCLEIRHDGSWATGAVSARKEATANPFSRLINRRTGLVTFAGLGAIAPGYTLLVPDRHVNSIGELPPQEVRDIYQTAWHIADLIRQKFSCASVVIEHGSSGASHDLRGAACITHAHIHIFPLNKDISPEQFVAPDSEKITDLEPLRDAAAQGRNYYYCAWTRAAGYLRPDAELGHQHARRVWARVLGKADDWDWAAAPHVSNARQTALRLRHAIQDEDVLETVSAYNCSGSRYAARTRDFARGSSLPEEIDWLADHTAGIVLDAGCGAGRDSCRFAQRDRDVVALDASISMLEAVPRHSRIRRLMGDIRNLPLATSSLGAVWCSAVLLHLDRSMVRAAFSEFFRVLSTAGLVTVSVKEGEGHDASPMPDSCGYRRHFYYYKLDDLIQFARLEGFEPIRTWAGVEPGADASPQRWVRGIFRKTRS